MLWSQFPAVAWLVGRFRLLVPLMLLNMLEPRVRLERAEVVPPGGGVRADLKKGLTRETLVVGVPDRDPGAEDRWNGCKRSRFALK